jgi:hypothetical protein
LFGVLDLIHHVWIDYSMRYLMIGVTVIVPYNKVFWE